MTMYKWQPHAHTQWLPLVKSCICFPQVHMSCICPPPPPPKVHIHIPAVRLLMQYIVEKPSTGPLYREILLKRKWFKATARSRWKRKKWQTLSGWQGEFVGFFFPTTFLCKALGRIHNWTCQSSPNPRVSPWPWWGWSFLSPALYCFCFFVFLSQRSVKK